MFKPPEKPAGPVVLSTNAICDGKFIPAGEPVPYERVEDLPPNLRPLVATGDEEFYSHSERLIYNQQPPEPGPVVFQQTGGGSQWQARRVAAGLHQQAWAEEQAEAANALPAETEEALEAAHAKHSALAKAQIQFNRDQVDAAYERAAQEAESRTVQLFVKRGGDFGRVERARLKPGEPVFVRRENGQYEVVGEIDSRGQPPDQEVIL